MDESEKRQVEEDFWKFMKNSIWYCARNVTRSASAAERRNGGISLEGLSEKSLGEFAFVEDAHELGDEIELIIRNIPGIGQPVMKTAGMVNIIAVQIKPGNILDVHHTT